MERDSRRDRGQWRGCHTFKDIILDGDDPRQRVPRTGGLKMGSTYYYYYELDGSTETHDPAMPSTTTCPYLPGQRLNTLFVPVEQSSRQRCASAGAARPSNYQTMNPADRYLTPQPSVCPAVIEPESASAPSSQPPSRVSSPKLRLRQPRSSSSLTASTWSPRRLFVRRPSPARNMTAADSSEDSSSIHSSTHSIHNSIHRTESPQPPTSSATAATVRAPRLVSWASSSSLSSLRRPTGTPSLRSLCVTTSSQSGGRSRDISPDSLRRFLVEDEPPKDEITSISAAASTADDEAYDDEHNFAGPAVVPETIPFTILSPPPPPRAVTPAPEEKKRPNIPTRAPPSVPASLGADQPQTGSSWLSLSPVQSPVLSPASPSSPPLPALSLSHGLHGGVSSPSCSVSHSETEDEDADMDYEAFLLPPRQTYGHGQGTLGAATGRSFSGKAAQERHEHLVAAFDSSFPDSNSAATLVPGGRLGDLVDELGWMATAIHD